MENAYTTGGEMTMKLFRTEDPRTQTAQMFAQFELGLLEGWFRFETNEGKQETAPSSSGARKRKHGVAPDASRKRRLRGGWVNEDPGWLVNTLDGRVRRNDKRDDEVYEDDVEVIRDFPSDPMLFLLQKSERPSPGNANWHFRWRGRETGTGEIDVTADEKRCWLIFGGEGGSKIKGKLFTTFGNFEFRGKKAAMLSSTEPVHNVSREWGDLSEDAWNRGCARRWG